MFSPIINLALLPLLASAAVAPLPRRTLTSSDVILWGSNGKVEVMEKAAHYAQVSTPVGRPAAAVNTTTDSTTSTNARVQTLQVLWRCRSGSSPNIPQLGRPYVSRGARKQRNPTDCIGDGRLLH